jgi:hypothetical protein
VYTTARDHVAEWGPSNPDGYDHLPGEQRLDEQGAVRRKVQPARRAYLHDLRAGESHRRQLVRNQADRLELR